MKETLARRELGEPLANRRRELEAVARAWRADHYAPPALEDEGLVGCGRVETRFGGNGVGLGEPVGLARPACDLLDQPRLGRAGLPRIRLAPAVVPDDLAP